MVIFSQHSLLKLKQRKIAKIKVIKTLGQPDYFLKSHLGRIIAYKKFNKLYLKVIFKKQGNNLLVITQYWTEGIKELR